MLTLSRKAPAMERQDGYFLNCKALVPKPFCNTSTPRGEKHIAISNTILSPVVIRCTRICEKRTFMKLVKLSFRIIHSHKALGGNLVMCSHGYIFFATFKKISYRDHCLFLLLFSLHQPSCVGWC